MTANQDPPGKPPGRLSPSELAEEVAKRLKSGGSGRGGHRRRPRFDIVTASRIAMALGVVLFGVGAVFAAAWIGRLAGFETTGTVIEETPVVGCPGEPEVGVLFSGETIELVGRSDDGAWFAVRDERGPGNVVYVDALRISPADDAERLSVRSCDPRDVDEVAGAAITNDAGRESATTTAMTVSTTTTPGETTSTSAVAGATGGRPPRRNAPSPGTTTTTTTTTTRPGATTTTTRPIATTTTTRPGSTSSSTSSSTTTTTQATTTTTSTTMPSTTTTTEATTTTTEATTTTTEATTTTTETTTTTTAP